MCRADDSGKRPTGTYPTVWVVSSDLRLGSSRVCTGRVSSVLTVSTGTVSAEVVSGYSSISRMPDVTAEIRPRAAAAGAWFTLGTVLSPLWNHHVPMGGSPASGTVYMRIMEQLGFFTALGVVIVFVAAVALGRIASVPSGIREIEEVEETTAAADTVPVETVRSEETRPVHTRLLPRRKTEDTTQTVG